MVVLGKRQSSVPPRYVQQTPFSPFIIVVAVGILVCLAIAVYFILRSSMSRFHFHYRVNRALGNGGAVLYCPPRPEPVGEDKTTPIMEEIDSSIRSAKADIQPLSCTLTPPVPGERKITVTFRPLVTPTSAPRLSWPHKIEEHTPYEKPPLVERTVHLGMQPGTIQVAYAIAYPGQKVALGTLVYPFQPPQ